MKCKFLILFFITNMSLNLKSMTFSLAQDFVENICLLGNLEDFFNTKGKWIDNLPSNLTPDEIAFEYLSHYKKLNQDEIKFIKSFAGFLLIKKNMAKRVS